jgi:tetratricopeptide (TPR) repeat protein
VPIDRAATLKQAERLLRQGKLDGAIAEYVRLVDDQPRDWNSVNALGDLYVRAGDTDRAVAQFTQIADHLFAEGFFPKAAALYKKALKIKSDHEHTLLRLSEIAAGQGLLADARMYLRQLGRYRRDRGDSRGAAECLVHLALLDEADAEAKLAGARAAQAIGDTPRATTLFKEAAEEFAKTNRQAEVVDALAEASALDPSDVELCRHVARECIAAGQLDRARAYLTRQSAGSDPTLLMALGRIELESGNDAEARSVLTRLMVVAPSQADVLLGVAGEMAKAGDLDRGFHCAEIVVDDALLAAHWDRAVVALERFLEHGPHIPALMKLVEVAVDAGRDDVMHEAQARLADAYLEAGRGAEARVIAEDLVARDPASDAHVNRLRRALDLLGTPDADAVLNRFRHPATAHEQPFDLDTVPGASDALSGDDVQPPADPAQPSATATATPAEEAIVIETLEIDLSEALAGLGGAPLAPPPAAVTAEASETTPHDLESVFEDMRSRVTGDIRGGDASEQYERALEYLEDERVADAVTELKSAARAPLFRFRASSRLGRLYVTQGELQEGIEWLERAAEAPAPSADEGLLVLYDLAGTLERVGETARALAVLLEIDADRSGYRDVEARIERLTRAQAGTREG